MFDLLKYHIKYKFHAFIAAKACFIYMSAPNDVIGDYFYRIHKRNVFKAHTARSIIEKGLKNV